MSVRYWVLGNDDITVCIEADGTIELECNDPYYSCTMTREQAADMAHSILDTQAKV